MIEKSPLIALPNFYSLQTNILKIIYDSKISNIIMKILEFFFNQNIFACENIFLEFDLQLFHELKFWFFILSRPFQWSHLEYLQYF